MAKLRQGTIFNGQENTRIDKGKALKANARLLNVKT